METWNFEAMILKNAKMCRLYNAPMEQGHEDEIKY